MKTKTNLTLIAFALFWALPLAAQTPASESVTLFQNVRIFDGKSGTLSAPSHLFVRGNKIEKISTTPLPVDRRADTVLIDGGGRTLMPGLIDMHWHAMLVRPTPAMLLTADIGYLNLVAIAEGIVTGPRIYPSGAVITTTGGHGDFRQPFELPRIIGGPLTRTEQLDGSMIADSADEVRMRVREQLMLGASQIKLTAGGGVASPHSPLDVSTFTSEELRAAVEAAQNWGT